MGNKESKQAVVVVIHLGTTSDGYAFQFVRRMGRVQLNPNWGSEVSSPYWMSPNCLLYNKNDVVGEQFGVKAELEYYNQLEETQGDGKPQLFRHFKKQLYGEGSRGFNFDRDMQLKSVDGTEKPALKVYADMLKSLKDQALGQIMHCCEWDPEVYDSNNPEDNICWVITMPDTWNRTWKSFLRQACVNAKLITKTESKNLLLPLESQCASLLCRNLTWDMLQTLDKTDAPTFRKGVYMIVNVEDEKVNVSVHHMEDSNDYKIEEVIAPIRATHDGKYIYNNLRDKIASTFGKEFVDHIQKNKPYLLYEIMRDFAKAMKRYQQDQVLHMKIHLAFASAYKEFTNGTTIRDAMESHTDGEIQLSVVNGFAISCAAVKEIIGNIAYDVKEAVFQAMEKVKETKNSEAKYIFFVGELVDWKIVQDDLRNIESFYNHKPIVLIPPEAALSMLRGGVAYGQNPYKLKKKHWKAHTKP